MKIVYKLLLFSAIALAASFGFARCTQADGYIGPWFGTWHIEQILIDGKEDPDYEANIVISFQGKIFKCGILESAEIYGSWEYAGEVLTLDAGYKTGTAVDFPHLFNPFPMALHFPADVEQIEITVVSINNRTMEWQYIDQNGDLLTYKLRKYP